MNGCIIETWMVVSWIETSGSLGQKNLKIGGPNWPDSFKTLAGPLGQTPMSSPDQWIVTGKY